MAMTDTDELAGLSEDVREALSVLVEAGEGYYAKLIERIRTELLRLTRDLHTETRVRKSRDLEYSELVKGFDATKVELAALKRRIAEARRIVMPVPPDEKGVAGKVFALLPVEGESSLVATRET